MALTYICIQTRTQTHTHTNTHSYIHAHTHTQLHIGGGIDVCETVTRDAQDDTWFICFEAKHLDGVYILRPHI